MMLLFDICKQIVWLCYRAMGGLNWKRKNVLGTRTVNGLAVVDHGRSRLKISWTEPPL